MHYIPLFSDSIWERERERGKEELPVTAFRRRISNSFLSSSTSQTTERKFSPPEFSEFISNNSIIAVCDLIRFRLFEQQQQRRKKQDYFIVVWLVILKSLQNMFYSLKFTCFSPTMFFIEFCHTINRLSLHYILDLI